MNNRLPPEYQSGQAEEPAAPIKVFIPGVSDAAKKPESHAAEPTPLKGDEKPNKTQRVYDRGWEHLKKQGVPLDADAFKAEKRFRDGKGTGRG